MRNTLQILAFLLLPCPDFAQIYLNEASSQNDSGIQDEFGNHSDWIELYNAGSQAVNLSGWFLSDDLSEPKKWAFPPFTVPPGGFLLVFASEENTFIQYPHTNFKLSQYGETIRLSNPQGQVIDQVDLPALDPDRSYGRLTDGNGTFAYFEIPSPNASNNGSPSYAFADPPEILPGGHFFEKPIQLAIQTSQSGCLIRYTLDGSLPNDSASLYYQPFFLDSTSCVRARSYCEGLLPSPVATKTIFIGTDHRLPIVALSTHPDLFWGWETGILVDGPNADPEWPHYGANYWADVEIPVHFEFFDEEKQFQISCNLGAQVHGGRGSRTHPQKSLRLLAKEEYGTEEINYRFFKDRDTDTFKRLVLRNASGDFNVAHMRDGFIQRLYIKDSLDVDGLAYQPVVLYLNGKFQGVINLREKADEFYVKYAYGIDIEDLDLLEEDSLVTVGDFSIFDEMYDYVVSQDLSVEGNFHQAASYFDASNIADYFIAETAINNLNSFFGNIKFWRERREGAKWRYMLFDLEAGLGLYGWSEANADALGNKLTVYNGTNRHVNIFNALLSNQGYKNYFINRYADLLNTTFRENLLLTEIEYSRDLIAHDMKQHFEVWTVPGFETWRDVAIPDLIRFAEERPGYARQHLQNHFGLTGQSRLELRTYPPGAGRIRINTIRPELPWDGIYFKGVPVALSIEPAPGYRFLHWQSLHAVSIPDPGTSITYDFQKADVLTAYFEAEYPGLELEISPNLLDGPQELEVSFLLDQIEAVEVVLRDALGKEIYRKSYGAMNGGLNTLSFAIPELPKGLYFLEIRAGSRTETEKVVVY